MIGRLRGILAEKHAPHLLLDVNGVFYEVLMPINVFARLPKEGEEVTIHIQFIIREDGHFLYGFIDTEQRALFRQLIKVNGVGPKLALAILSGMESNVFVGHIKQGEAGALERVPGIGKKLAQRLIVEMRDSLAEWDTSGISLDILTANIARDAISALVALGYKPQQAREAIVKFKDKNISSEEMVRLALREIK